MRSGRLGPHREPRVEEHIRGRLLCAAALAALAAWTPAAAQGRWSFELDGGATIPTGKLAGAELETGFGLGANVRVRLQADLPAYAGWAYHTFRTDAVLGLREIDVDDTGYGFGLRFEHPVFARSSGWVRLGGIADHIELENEAGDIIGDTGHGLGYEVGAGLTIPVGARFALTPGGRFWSLSRDLEVDSRSENGRLSYLLVGAGITFGFRARHTRRRHASR